MLEGRRLLSWPNFRDHTDGRKCRHVSTRFAPEPVRQFKIEPLRES